MRQKVLPYSYDWWDREDEDREGDGKLMPAEDWVESEGDNGFGLILEAENNAEIGFV